MATGHHCGEGQTSQQLCTRMDHHHRTHARLFTVTGREEEKLGYLLKQTSCWHTHSASADNAYPPRCPVSVSVNCREISVVLRAE